MNYFAILKAALSLLPIIIDAIKAIEAAFPEGSNGQHKLEVVKTTVQSAMDVATDVIVPFEQVWPVLQGMIAAIVSAFNALGVFTKKSEQPA